jgi:hypothetical protein
MKSGCEYEQLFESYFRSDLSPAEELALLNHLKSCENCRAQLDKFYAIHTLLTKHQRSPVPSDIQKSYYRQVDLSYGQETFSDKLALFAGKFTEKRSPIYRALQFTTLIIIGLVAGWLLFAPAEPKIVFQKTEPYQMSQPISMTDLDYVHKYLQVSEMILQEIQNENDFYLNRELAQKYLIKTSRVIGIAYQLNNTRMINFLNHMEQLLHEASNLNEENIDESVAIIRKVINDFKLLREIRELKLLIETTRAQAEA